MLEVVVTLSDRVVQDYLDKEEHLALVEILTTSGNTYTTLDYELDKLNSFGIYLRYNTDMGDNRIIPWESIEKITIYGPPHTKITLLNYGCVGHIEKED